MEFKALFKLSNFSCEFSDEAPLSLKLAGQVPGKFQSIFLVFISSLGESCGKSESFRIIRQWPVRFSRTADEGPPRHSS